MSLALFLKAYRVEPLIDDIPSRQTRGGRMFWVRRSPFHDNMDDMWSLMENWMNKRSIEDDDEMSGKDDDKSVHKMGHKFGHRIEQQYPLPL